MAWPWRAWGMGKNSANVALPPRLWLAVWRKAGHIEPKHALDGCWLQPGREFHASSAVFRPGNGPDSQPLILGGLTYDRRRQGRLCLVFWHPERSSGGFLRRRARVRSRDPEDAGGSSRSDQAGGPNQSIQGKKRLDPRYFGAAGS